MKEPIVVFKDVSYQYPQSTRFSLININLEINKSEFFGLIGPTGAGKTTLCLGFTGIVPQFYGGRFFGSVSVLGLDTLENPISTMAGHVGLVFEDPETQLITASVENEIAFALENLSVPRDTIADRISDSLSAVRLDGYEKKHPHELSGGEKQRLAIAAAMAIKPSVLVLDEPTSQLDSVGAEDVFMTAQRLNREFGMTIVMASHSAEEMAEYADRIGLMYQGEIVALGTPDEIYSKIEMLEKYNLRPPEVARIFGGLRKNGISVPKIPVRMQDAIPLLENLSTCKNSNNIVLNAPPTNRKKPIISVEALSHVYPDGTEALRDISLEISEGEYVVLVGQNGAGKTTLVKHCLNLLQPTDGFVKINGLNTAELSISDLAQIIGYVAQNPDNQIFNSTVGDEIGFALKNLGYDPEEVEARVVKSLEEMGLINMRDRHPLSLPKGDRARVIICAILAMKP
ncbi:MAG: ABC transporter ATP-binding protein, partial [Anaerolineales bacterium]